MFKTLNMAGIRCPVGFSEELSAVFKVKKSQVGTEMDKKPKRFKLSKFLGSFCQIFDQFGVDWNVEK